MWTWKGIRSIPTSINRALHDRQLSFAATAQRCSQQPTHEVSSALPSAFLQHYVVGVNWKKAAILSSCSMSSVHGLLCALGELRMMCLLICCV